MMTRQDYEAVAEGIRQAKRSCVENFGEPTRLFLSNVLVPMMAAQLATTNPRFDMDRFVEACNKEAP